MRRFALPLVALTLAAAACGGGDDGGAVGSEAELRETVEDTFQALLDGDADRLYDSFSSDFRDRCDEKDFKRIMGLAALFIGEVESEIDVIDTDIDGDHATVTVQIETEEEGVEVSQGDDDDFLHDWVYEDGAWKTETDDPDPCNVDSMFGPGDDDDEDEEEEEEEASGPGMSRREALGVGDTVTTGGVEVTVTEADLDAGARVAELSEFADQQLLGGHRFVLLRVHVKHAGEDGEAGEETKQVSASDFKLTGDRNVLYDGFDATTTCGFLDDELGGEMFPGGELEGYVCFQAPESEDGLILVFEPFFSFEDSDRRYIALE